MPRRHNRLTRSVRRDASVAEASRQSFSAMLKQDSRPRERTANYQEDGNRSSNMPMDRALWDSIKDDVRRRFIAYP